MEQRNVYQKRCWSEYFAMLTLKQNKLFFSDKLKNHTLVELEQMFSRINFLSKPPLSVHFEPRINCFTLCSVLIWLERNSQTQNTFLNI